MVSLIRWPPFLNRLFSHLFCIFFISPLFLILHLRFPFFNPFLFSYLMFSFSFFPLFFSSYTSFLTCHSPLFSLSLLYFLFFIGSLSPVLYSSLISSFLFFLSFPSVSSYTSCLTCHSPFFPTHISHNTSLTLPLSASPTPLTPPPPTLSS